MRDVEDALKDKSCYPTLKFASRRPADFNRKSCRAPAGSLMLDHQEDLPGAITCFQDGIEGYQMKALGTGLDQNYETGTGTARRVASNKGIAVNRKGRIGEMRHRLGGHLRRPMAQQHIAMPLHHRAGVPSIVERWLDLELQVPAALLD